MGKYNQLKTQMLLSPSIPLHRSSCSSYTQNPTTTTARTLDPQGLSYSILRELDRQQAIAPAYNPGVAYGVHRIHGAHIHYRLRPHRCDTQHPS
ncbi:MAG: hypothetical protein P8104_01640, partial [Gammaproteobacteria bacterium]